MKAFSISILLSLVLLSNSFVFGQLEETVIGKINLIEKDNMFIIKAQVENNESFLMENLSYYLLVLKKSVFGKYSTQKQTGEFSLLANEKKMFSEVRLNLNEGKEIKVYLFIKKDKILISKDSLIILSHNKQLTQKELIKESDFKIKGVVVEDVITKIGKDFYDYFYQDYSTSGSKYSFIINIKEKPYFGRSSIITVKVDDNIVHEFMSQPDEEFLKSKAKITLRNLNQYAIQRKVLFTKVKY